MKRTKRVILFLTALLLSTFSATFAQKSLTNVALNASVSASSEERPANAALDGDHTSYWQSGSFVGTHWLNIDLGHEHEIDRILLPLVTGVNHLVIEVEKENGVWKEVYSGDTANPLIGIEPERTRRIRLTSVDGGQMRIYEVRVYEFDPQPVFLNQSGFDLYGIKRFTAPLAKDGASYTISRNDNTAVLYNGFIHQRIGDFSDFQPEADYGPYVVHVNGENGLGSSVPFYIGPNWMERVTYQPAIDFMVDTRCWFGDSRLFKPTSQSAGCPDLGVAWRDSHQMSFEIPSLLHLYFSNPSAFLTDRMPVQGEYLGLREELPEHTPEVVRLIYWAVDIYLRGEVNHTLLKQQLAWFVYAWPWLSEYIPEKVYQEALEYVLRMWGDENKNRWPWHDVEHTANLFQTYKIIGTGKGELPTGHSIVPNLLMYEIAKREGKNNPEDYFQAAYNQTQWLIENLDWHDPLTTKGQRQGEWVAITSFVHFLEHYAGKAPDGLLQKIKDWSEVAIRRSYNLWDFRKYSDERWIIPGIGHPHLDRPLTGFNEVGNVAGFPAPLIAATKVIEDQNIVDRLNQIAIAHIDHVFGRNPTGRHFSFDGPQDFEGVNEGWFQEYQGGAGILQPARGVLDGSAKETTFPYNPYAGDPGHTEGWVTFNTPWNISLAYMSAQKTSVSVFDSSFTKTISSAKPGAEIGIEITAPLNFDYAKKEHGEAFVYLSNRLLRVAVEEVSTSSNRFRGTFTVPGDQTDPIKVAYGIAWHETYVMLAVE
jgi:hypothetical protein